MARGGGLGCRVCVSCRMPARLQLRLAWALAVAHAAHATRSITKVGAAAQVDRRRGGAVVPGEKRQGGQSRTLVGAVGAYGARYAFGCSIRWPVVVVSHNAHAVGGGSSGGPDSHSVLRARFACRSQELADQRVVCRDSAAACDATDADVTGWTGIALLSRYETRTVRDRARWAERPRG